MDFFTDLMGLILLIVCILIVLIFLKDYIRLGGKKTTVNKKQKMIVYEVHQNNKRIQQGWITDDQSSAPSWSFYLLLLFGLWYERPTRTLSTLKNSWKWPSSMAFSNRQQFHHMIYGCLVTLSLIITLVTRSQRC